MVARDFTVCVSPHPRCFASTREKLCSDQRSQVCDSVRSGAVLLFFYLHLNDEWHLWKL